MAPSVSVTCEGVEYLRGKGYGVAKDGPDDDRVAEKLPRFASSFDEYAREFCKLNNLPLIGFEWRAAK